MQQCFLFSQCWEKLSWVCNWVIVSHTRVQWILQSHISKGSWPSLSSLKRQRKLPKNPSTEGKWEETSGEAFQRKIPPSWSCSGICEQERKEMLIYREVRAVICFSLFSLHPSTLDLKWKSGYDFKVLTFNSFKCSHLLYMSNGELRAEFTQSPKSLDKATQHFKLKADFFFFSLLMNSLIFLALLNFSVWNLGKTRCALGQC